MKKKNNIIVSLVFIIILEALYFTSVLNAYYTFFSIVIFVLAMIFLNAKSFTKFVFDNQKFIIVLCSCCALFFFVGFMLGSSFSSLQNNSIELLNELEVLINPFK